MLEPDVTLTDFAVAAECAAFTLLLIARPAVKPDLRRLFAIFFAAIGAGGLAGGLVHGYFPDDAVGAGAALWRLTLVSLGAAAFAAWSIGARLLLSDTAARTVKALALAVFAVYTVVVLAVDQSFWIAIAGYAPAVLFLGVAFAVRRERAGLSGVLLTVAAAVVQQRPGTFDFPHVSHNAVYHLIEMAALGLFFVTARRVTSS